METKFKVTNNTGGQLKNQHILVFLTPIDSADDWLYAQWQNLQPGDGGSEFFTLNNNISGILTIPDDFETNKMPIDPGLVSLYTNKIGDPKGSLQPPVSGSQVDPPTVTGNQSGIKNESTNPAQAPYAQWFVNENLTVQSISPISAGGTLSAFELKTTLYWAVGAKQEGANYTLTQITKERAYVLPAGTRNVQVTVGYVNNQFTWTFDPASK